MTEPSEAIAAAAAVFAAAWSGRPPAERDAFARRLPDPGATEPVPESAEAVRTRAALCGAVEPGDLVRGIAEGEAARVLDLLAPTFDQVYAEGRWHWTLHSDARESVLRRLCAAGALHGATRDAAPIPTDAAGHLLRRLARGKRVPAATPVAVAVQALTWAAPIGGLAGELAEVRRRAVVDAVADGYEGLLHHGFFDRVEVRGRLADFAGLPVDATRPVPLVVVTGIGGAGKSTMLAAFLMPYLRRQAASEADPQQPVVIVIDFDRPQFRVDAELELSFEVTRQLGTAHPVAGADFSALRYQTREEHLEAGAGRFGTENAADVSSRSADTFEFDARRIVDLHGLGARPVLLVLDTFEQWQRHRPHPGPREPGWNDPEERLLGWIERLRYQMGLVGLRVVVSGRAELTPTTRVELRWVERLGDLPPRDATQLLEAHDLSTDHARALAQLVGGNPLTLRVAARYVGRLPSDERAAFLAEGADATQGLDTELRRAVLYDRFLAHIEDDRVRALAHPGLVLRRVTPALVEHVLAPHCGLGPIGAGVAADLTERLADEVWLVKRDGEALLHLTDVRRAMLHLMTTDPEPAAAAREIHRAAARWYAEGRDTLPGPAAAAEALYHRLMALPPDADVDAKTDVGALAGLGESVEDLPRRTAVQVRVLRGDDIPDADAGLLPDRLWRPWVERRGRELVDTGQAPRAVELIGARPGRAPDGEPTWLAQAYCDAARWPEYWKRVEPTAELSVQRYAAVNAVCCGDLDQLARYGAVLDEYLADRPAEPSALFFSLLAGVHVRWHGLSGWPHRGLGRDLLRNPADARAAFPIDQFRDVVAWAADGFSRSTMRTMTLREVAGLLRPDPRWLADFARLTGVGPDLPPLRPYDRRAGDVLNRWTLEVARHFGKGATIRPDALRHDPALVWVLRGDNPELRRGILWSLSDVLRGEGLRRLAALAVELLPIPVPDLRPEEIAPDDGSYRPSATLIEYVDRSGVMRGFLDGAQALWPESPAVGRARDAFAAWDDANNRLLDALRRHLSAGA